MLNKLQSFVRRQNMLEPGDRVICAVSGGADSVALLFAMYLLAPKLDITVEAAHFNHGLRGSESDADAQFVSEFCDRYDIPLHMGQGKVVPGKKGLEAAARKARYAFLQSLPGKIATAHTADDNAETLLINLIRGTGLKGLGGIAPVRNNLIRPMLTVTRQDVLDFLAEYNLIWREDSSNAGDDFLRNRLRHKVIPLLKDENPSLAPNLSHMALRLREDEQVLSALAELSDPDINQLRGLSSAVRTRWIAGFLVKCGVVEPEREHIEAVEALIFSNKPSARTDLPGGITVARCYDCLQAALTEVKINKVQLSVPCEFQIPGTGLWLSVSHADALEADDDSFTVKSSGELILRSRESGDSMRLPGGTKSLKKLYIDRKIPAARRAGVAVLADAEGVLAVDGIGPNLDRLAKELPALKIRFEKREKEGVL